MIERYVSDGARLERIGATGSDARSSVWIDLYQPTHEEVQQIEGEFAVDIPTPEDMREIEMSSRLYQAGTAHVMTASVIYKSDAPEPHIAEVTFILLPSRLITVRHTSPHAFQMFASQAASGDIASRSPPDIMIGILEAMIERLADHIERIQATTGSISHQIFEVKGGEQTRAKRHAASLREVGKLGEMASRARESLVSLGRLLMYFGSAIELGGSKTGVAKRIKAALQDVRALSAHVDHLSGRLTFLMDATIGLIGIEQNQIIKLFTVVAVMLMPPTLIASVYGMNFKTLPELGFAWGYPVAVAAMAISALLPCVYFKRKGWL